jgi:hypothetical protein
MDPDLVLVGELVLMLFMRSAKAVFVRHLGPGGGDALVCEASEQQASAANRPSLAIAPAPSSKNWICQPPRSNPVASPGARITPSSVSNVDTLTSLT